MPKERAVAPNPRRPILGCPVGPSSYSAGPLFLKSMMKFNSLARARVIGPTKWSTVGACGGGVTGGTWGAAGVDVLVVCSSSSANASSTSRSSTPEGCVEGPEDHSTKGCLALTSAVKWEASWRQDQKSCRSHLCKVHNCHSLSVSSWYSSCTKSS
jgi:hypothetical protein